MMKAIIREWRFMFRQRYLIALLFCAFATSTFSIFTGVSEINTQRQTIERLTLADEKDRSEAQAKHNDPGSLAYYSFHLTYSAPSDLAFAALGDRDIYPWKHRIRMLAIEGQIYESDVQNAELSQAGKIDFVFIISVLSPLFLILLFHDLIASERVNGRHDLLLTTAKSPFSLWGIRIIVRLLSIFVCLLLPFYVGAFVSHATLNSVLLISFWCLLYFIFWALLSIYLGKESNSAPKIASSLIAIWVLFVFIIPILGDLAIKQKVDSPKGADILLTQREAVNDAWDLPAKITMDAFVATHPSYKDYTEFEGSFDWKWYYAFQQVGDQKAATLSSAYKAAALKKYQLAHYVTWLSPPMMLQRKISRLAESDAIAGFNYEQKVREFHQSLREFYYPWLFIHNTFDKEALNKLPKFEASKQLSN